MCFNVERIFNPVGQGGFYEERFYSDENFFNFVFDCGTNNKRALFSKLLNHKDYNTINLLCISHFDNDHVSLLPTFLKGKKVETLFMPHITNDIIYSILLSIGGVLPDDEAEEEFDKILNNQYMLLSDPKKFMNSINGDVERIVYIKQGFKEHFKEESLDDYITTIEELPFKETLPSGTDFKSNKFPVQWIFKPVNISFSKGSLKENFINEILKIISNNKNYNDKYTKIEDINESFLKEAICDRKLIAIIRKAYHGIYKGDTHKEMNDYSMALYSGLLNNNIDVQVSRLKRCKYSLSDFEYLNLTNEFVYLKSNSFDYHGKLAKHRAGCLYLGDYNTKDDEYYEILEHYYNPYKNKFSFTLQVPHHGSIHSWNKKLLNWAKDFIVSYGSNNHRHPSPDVLLDVIKEKPFFEITHSENSSLKYLIEVSYK